MLWRHVFRESHRYMLEIINATSRVSYFTGTRWPVNISYLSFYHLRRKLDVKDKIQIYYRFKKKTLIHYYIETIIDKIIWKFANANV